MGHSSSKYWDTSSIISLNDYSLSTGILPLVHEYTEAELSYTSENIDINNEDNSKRLDLHPSHDSNVVLTDLSTSSATDSRSLVSKENADLKSLLSKWNLESLLGEFIAQKITIDILKIIKRHHIERLLKTFEMGTQILFEHNLEQWRESIGIPLTYPNCTTLAHKQSVFCSDPPSPATSSSSYRESTPPASPNRHFKPYDTTPTEQGISNKISLATILNETSRGKMLVEYYNTKSKFQEEQRSMSISAIANYFEEKRTHMSLAASHRIEREIVERFPTEKLEYYRTNKRGKIYIKYGNLKTSLKYVSGNTEMKKRETQNKPSRLDKVFDPEMDAESCLRALKFDNLSCEQFDNTWKACCQFRLEFIKLHSTIEIMEKFPFYKLPWGYRLIDMDFKVAFGNENALLDQWDSIRDKTISFLIANNRIKDKNVKILLENLQNPSISENGRNAALIWALHGYLVPTSKVVKKDVVTGRKCTTKFTDEINH